MLRAGGDGLAFRGRDKLSHASLPNLSGKSRSVGKSMVENVHNLGSVNFFWATIIWGVV